MTGIASRGQLRMSFLRYALVTVPLILLLGLASGRLSDSGYGNPWFYLLAKPDLTPPGWVFATVWPTLYVLLGLALAMILHARGSNGRGLAIGVFILQMLLNFLWSPVFFAWHRIGLALGLILAILLLSAVATLLFARIRKGAALLMLPYLAWLGFATYLNYQILQMNPDGETLAPGAASTDIAL